jgi:hypothetical protein
MHYLFDLIYSSAPAVPLVIPLLLAFSRASSLVEVAVLSPLIFSVISLFKAVGSFENSVLLEALKKLEKLKRIVWLDDSRVILSDNLARISGNTYDVYIEKVIHGRALVIVNGKWHARLNHYDYEGPREFLKKGKFMVVGELYRDEDVFSLRVKQII